MLKRKINFKSKKGQVSILIAVLLLSLTLMISLSVSYLMFRQIRATSQMGQSVVAFYAADAGAERCLYEVRRGSGECPFTDEPLELSKYTAVFDGSNQILSTGYFLSTSRRIEITWELPAGPKK